MSQRLSRLAPVTSAMLFVLLVSAIVALFVVGPARFDQFGQGAQATVAPSADQTWPAVEVVQRVGLAVVTVINEQQSESLGNDQIQPVGSGTGFIIDDKDSHHTGTWGKAR